MAKVESSTTIKRPAEDVFAVLSNPENDPKWQSGSLEAKQTSAGPIGVGTTARFVSKCRRCARGAVREKCGHWRARQDSTARMP